MKSQRSNLPDAMPSPPRRGIAAALLAAALFGGSTAMAKPLLNSIQPVVLAGVLYLASAAGLSLFMALRAALAGGRGEPPQAAWRGRHWIALGGSTALGGALAPVLLLSGLRVTPASSAALLLNLEAVFTAILAWAVFREAFDRRLALGMLFIVAGGLALSWSGRPSHSLPWGALAVAAACLCWGLDNNLTRSIADRDPILIAAIKGAVAGGVNLALGLGVLRGALPETRLLAWGAMAGLLGYGISLALFVYALRLLGTARTGAYFSTGPFCGALLSAVFLREPLSPALLSAGTLMAAGVWLHLTERHTHEHTHEPLTHCHPHTHDAHHQHGHAPGSGLEAPGPHTHEHTHTALRHAHPHYPDIHHRHTHGNA